MKSKKQPSVMLQILTFLGDSQMSHPIQTSVYIIMDLYHNSTDALGVIVKTTASV